MSMVVKQCLACKKEFEAKGRITYENPKKYCSQKCARVGRRNESLREKRICAHCGREFTFYLAYSNSVPEKNPGRYCSKRCDDEDSRATLECAKCGKSFTVFACMGKIRKYCSQQCAGVRTARIPKVCVRCGEKYGVIPSQAPTSRYCSFLCKVRYEGEQRRKPLEDATSKNRRLQSKEWKDIRQKVLRRDGFSCRRCGSPDRLNIHHVEPWRISHNNDPSNLVTLCLSCHQTVEPRGRYSQVNSKQKE